jgi:hypothetical protein
MNDNKLALAVGGAGGRAVRPSAPFLCTSTQAPSRDKCWVGGFQFRGPGIRLNPPESDPRPNPCESGIHFCRVKWPMQTIKYATFPLRGISASGLTDKTAQVKLKWGRVGGLGGRRGVRGAGERARRVTGLPADCPQDRLQRHHRLRPGLYPSPRRV